MAGLQSSDIFLVNREKSGVWGSYKVNFADLADEVAKEITLNLPELGYDEVSQVVSNPAKFSTDAYSATKDMSTVTELIVHDSLTNANQAAPKMQVVVLNRTTGEAVYYKVTGAPVTGGGTITIPVQYDTGTGTLHKDDLCNIRKVDVSTGGGGGSINIGICPPGYEYNTGSLSCDLLDPSDPDAEVEAGTLWYNPNDGVTYIWYLNELDPDLADPFDGQWVDVRPGFGEGQDITFDDTPPADPEPGDLWYNTNNGITYIWYLDKTTGNGQWVDVRPSEDGGINPADFVEVAGDNMTGNLTLGTDKIVLDASSGDINAKSYSGDGVATNTEARAGVVTNKINPPSNTVPKDASGMAGAALIPGGTDAQRPASPVTGMIRYNTTATPPVMEYYDGTQWSKVGGGGAVKEVIYGTAVLNNTASVNVSHANVDVSKSYIIITGTGINNNDQRAYQPWISNRTSTRFTPTAAAGSQLSVTVSYEIVIYE